MYILIFLETSFSYLLYIGHYSRSRTSQRLKRQLSIWELSTAHNNFISFVERAVALSRKEQYLLINYHNDAICIALKKDLATLLETR